jgi:quinol monooxygenase YgiN
MFVWGLFSRISNSLFMEWRSHQAHPEYLTTTDFQAAMAENHCHLALRLVLNKHPSLKLP